MTRDADREFASAFDGLLDRNKQALDALYRKSGAAPVARQPDVRPPAAARGARDAPGDSAARQILRARFGDDWRYEVSQRQREGGEVVVLGKLTIPSKNVVKAQFGHARHNGSGGEEAAYGEAAEVALARCVSLL